MKNISYLYNIKWLDILIAWGGVDIFLEFPSPWYYKDTK